MIVKYGRVEDSLNGKCLVSVYMFVLYVWLTTHVATCQFLKCSNI